jgi:hypothetical protein
MSPRAEILAEFETEQQLSAAARTLRAQGYRALDAYIPYPAAEVEEALGLRRSWLSRYVLVAGLVGAGAAYVAQWWISAVDYPLNIGGRPQHSPLAFVPITFEMGVLLAALVAVAALLLLAGLPRLWHPVFAVPGFERATIDRFWLSISAADPQFDRLRTAQELAATGPLQIAWTGESEDGK